VNYERIADDGLHITFGPDRQRPRLLAVDNVVLCAGQEPARDLEAQLRSNGINPHIIGGAAIAAKLDAKRDQTGHRTGIRALDSWAVLAQLS
jgi:2,4-dienoyl-CoA reductase (NADPH2)